MTSDDLSPTAADGPAGPELDQVRHAFLTARGDQDDPRWAETALVALVFADVRIDAAEACLIGAAGLVQQSQESPEQLYGPAREWAAEQVESLRGNGQEVFEDPLRFDLRESVLTVLGLAAGLSALFVASDLLWLLLGSGSAKGLTAGLALAPLLLSAVLVALIRVYSWSSRRFAFPVVVLWCALLLAVCSGGTAAVIVPLGQTELLGSRWWMIALVGVYGLAAYLVATVWRPRPAAPRPLTVPEVLAGGDVGDQEWLERARAVLRERGDLPEKRISAVLREAKDHAADRDARLLEEFSSPEEYARSLPRDPRVKPRRMTLLYGAVAVGWAATGCLVGAEDGWEPGWRLGLFAVLVVLCLWSAWMHARDWRAAARLAAEE
ncbi:MAG: hypothetical protein ACTHWF_06435 [Brachybacterium sp.]